MFVSVRRRGTIKFGGIYYFACFSPGSEIVKNYEFLIYSSFYLLSVARQISVFSGNN